jgi:hypothetical protein
MAAALAIGASAHAQYIINSGGEPYKPGRNFDEDGNPVISSKRSQKFDVNIDYNILQPGKRFDMPGHENDQGTNIWDKASSRPRHLTNEQTAKKKNKRRPIED